MHSPPFKLAHKSQLGGSFTDTLTRGGGAPRDEKPAVARQGHQEPASAARLRTRLVDLDHALHCSVIGTCLTMGDLRKLVPRYVPMDRHTASDLEIHHEAVQLAVDGGEGCKAIEKALDTRHALAIKRFHAARDADAVLALWADALKSGDVPPAYWALMSHPYSTIEVRQIAFGEVHMLSHLVGAANRADIRRLVALEQANAALHDQVENQHARIDDMSREHAAALRDAHAQIARLTFQVTAQAAHLGTDAQTEVATLRETLSERDQQLALRTQRVEAAERRVEAFREEAKIASDRLDAALALLKVVEAEADAVERAMLNGEPETATRRAELGGLAGKRIVYVGGRPGSNAVIRSLVHAAGGEIVLHDGGIEDRKGLLASALVHADVAVFPVDCIDHDSMNTIKRVCERNGVPYYPLRSAGVASFVELATRDGAFA